ncbi:MAG: MarR family winged helix-turn-helix transcriptional regulator [Methylococcales bacterium]|nr:MarR family winged helix-turn-helix transcriptional regulator [Methylococcales bacterium]
MPYSALFSSLERIMALLRSEQRRNCAHLGLQAVHLQVMEYLAQCNRFSDTPAAVASYLGITKGTVSQTLLLLQKKGYVCKTPDLHDRRIVHLSLTEAGREVARQASAESLFQEASRMLPQQHHQLSASAFAEVLRVLQKAHKNQSFGLCRSCRHFIEGESQHQCGLTLEPLSDADSKKICQEHAPR